VSASRGIFAMARDRRLPRLLATTSKKYGSPVGSTVFIVVFSLLTLAADLWWKGLFALPATPHYFAIFAWGSTFGGFALVVVYLMMALGSVRSFGPTQWVAALVALAITGGAIFGSFYKVTSPTIEAPWYAIGVLVLGYLSTFVFKPRAAASTQLSDLTKSAV
jgi:amino acid transporter